MPIIYNENGLLLWRIDESERELEALVTEKDRKSAARMGSAERRRGHLAWRAALRTALPDAEVRYDNNGAPHIDGAFVSASHTQGLAAVRIAAVPCGVDVERADRNLSAVRARFVSENEEQLADAGRDDFAVSVWCAKEVMYKMAGRRESDFLRDLIIEEICLEKGTIAGMTVKKINGWVIVFK